MNIDMTEFPLIRPRTLQLHCDRANEGFPGLAAIECLWPGETIFHITKVFHMKNRTQTSRNQGMHIKNISKYHFNVMYHFYCSRKWMDTNIVEICIQFVNDIIFDIHNDNPTYYYKYIHVIYVVIRCFIVITLLTQHHYISPDHLQNPNMYRILLRQTVSQWYQLLKSLLVEVLKS